ncbi:glycosyltransferase family 2 protein [Aureimonas populi]|uniref:Glycosyltransferase family 2 protein n=1 Tax=Aureimonas populi TaxID=1701758 RepID=A0ABW5CNA4_9HYPH|nr:glycosyltransferase family A protein [Aureimonas populi]
MSELAKSKVAPKVVVVIPFYNGSDTIERAARSVLDQTIPATEFVVVDDGSRKDEADKLDEIAARMGFRVLRKENGGQGSARNAGVAATTSPFICFLDQDDFYLRHHIEVLADAMPENDSHFGWVYGELFEAEKDGSVVRTSIVSHHASHPKTNIFDLIRYDMHVLPSAAMIGREAYEAVGGFDPQFMGYEDDDLFLRMFRKGYTNYFTEKPVTVWCIHTESTSYGIRMARSRLRYFKKLAGSFPDDEIKRRFFMRDLLIPRFHNLIMDEAILASVGELGKYETYKEEYIQIANEYGAIVISDKSVPRQLKRRLALHLSLINSPRWAKRIYKLRPFIGVIRAVKSRILRI